MQKRFVTPAIASVLLLGIVTASNANAPRTLPLQGSLTMASGTPVQGSVAVTFTLYNQANVAVWTETKALMAQDGRFATQLGSVTPFPTSVGFNEPYTLGVKVGADPEMTPRLALGSAPSAMTLALPATAVVASSSVGLTLNNSGTGGAARLSVENTASLESVLELNHSGGGPGLTINLLKSSSSARALSIVNAGGGPGVYASSTGGHGLWGLTGSSYSAGVLGDNTAGEAVVGRTSGPDGVGAVVGRSDGAGYGVRGFNTKAGIGVLGQAGIGQGTGMAARFENVNSANNTDVVTITGNGNGNSLVVNQANPTGSTALQRNIAVFQSGGARVARIDKLGRGYFNGGTQASGADVAEAFAVVGDRAAYGPGDVLVIATDQRRAVTKTTEPYSTRISGVVATRPGLMLTERSMDEDLSDLVMMGVIGVVPTKVTAENGPIRAGDLLVTSSKAGYAMKGTDRQRMVGAILGKALEPCEGDEGVIQVLVSLK